MQQRILERDKELSCHASGPLGQAASGCKDGGVRTDLSVSARRRPRTFQTTNNGREASMMAPRNSDSAKLYSVTLVAVN
jgi:hypothetical protein